MSSLTVQCVGIQEFAITSESLSAGIYTAVVPGLPVDGSLGVAFLLLDESMGNWRYGQKRHFIAFLEGTSDTRTYEVEGDPQTLRSLKLPSGWCYISAPSIPV